MSYLNVFILVDSIDVYNYVIQILSYQHQLQCSYNYLENNNNIHHVYKMKKKNKRAQRALERSPETEGF